MRNIFRKITYNPNTKILVFYHHTFENWIIIDFEKDEITFNNNNKRYKINHYIELNRFIDNVIVLWSSKIITDLKNRLDWIKISTGIEPIITENQNVHR